MNKPLPDWTAIFTVHPELDPPGYAETFIEMAGNRRERPARGKGKGKEARFPSLKHGVV